MLIISILVLALLIFVHELGHFLVARYTGVGVLEFSIGFGKKIWSKKIGDTNYSIGIIPLGGYVRMVGDDPSFLETLTEEEEKEVIENFQGKPDKWFLNKKYWEKVAIVAAGPGFNLIFAIILSFFVFLFFGLRVPVDKPVIGDVIPGFPAQVSGLQSGDLVRRIDGKEISDWIMLADTIRESAGEELVFDIERKIEGGTENLEIILAGTSDTSTLDVIDGVEKTEEEKKDVKIGIVPSTEHESVSFLEAGKYSFIHVYQISKMTLRGLWGMIRGAISPKHIAGPIFIFQEAANSAKRGIEKLSDFIIFLSISLALLNLLPIPILDGGHILFFTIEALKGGPISLRYQNIANQIGMLLLLLLMVFAVGNDIRRLIE